MNHQDLQLKVVEQTMKKAMNNMSHVMKFKKITGMMKMICLIKVQNSKGMLQNHLACISHQIRGMVTVANHHICCTASIIINQPRD